MLNDPATSGDAAAASLDHWKPLFGATLARAAQTLIDNGAVSQLRVLQNGRIITGLVDNVQRVYVQVHSSGTPRVDGECGCNASSPCVHVAALVMAASTISRESPAARPIGTVTPPRPDEGGAAPGASTQKLLYSIQAAGATGPCQLTVWVSHAAPDPAAHTPRRAQPFAARPAAGTRDYPRYVDPQDRQILSALTAEQTNSPWPLSGSLGFALLQRVVATGRAHWGATPESSATSGILLRPGPARPQTFAWLGLPNGDQQLEAVTAATLDLLLALDPPVYIDRVSGACGPLEFPYSLELLRRHWQRAAIPPQSVREVNAQLAGRTGARGTAGTEPFPRLHDFALRERPLDTLTGRLALTADPRAILQFVYNGNAVDGDVLGAHPAVRRLEGSTVHEIPRDLDKETRLRAELKGVLPETPRDGEAWLGFMMQGVPALQALGWELVVDANFPYRLATADAWYADLQRTHSTKRSHEWFDLRLGVTVDGQPVNLLPALMRYLHGALGGETAGQHDALSLLTGGNLLIRLEDGRYLPVAIARIQRIADTLVELYDHDGLNKQEALTLPAAQAGRLAQLTFESAAPPATSDPALTLNSDDPALLTLVDAVKSFSGILPLAAPLHFHATLRPYQQEGLGWLQFLRRTGLGGILADDMGLGKTVQTLAHLLIEKREGRLRKPSLIVAPVSVLGNWQQEIRRFVPELHVVTLHGAKRKGLFAGVKQADVILIGYPLLVIDSELLLPQEFYFVILDEAQTIKNPQAKVSQIARTLRADHRLCLTGTPMENHLGELWSLSISCSRAYWAIDKPFIATIEPPSRMAAIPSAPLRSAAACSPFC